MSVEAWEQQQEKAIREFMEKAKAILLESGFPNEAITLRIDERKIGIARDIAAESKNGYKALAVGRRGLSDLKDFMLGSVASTSSACIHPGVDRGRRAPADKGPRVPGRFRRVNACLDPSSDVLGTSKNCEITLFHAVPGFHSFKNFVREVFSSEKDKTSIEKIERELDKAAELLEPSFR